MIEFIYTGSLDGRDVTGRVAGGKITGNPFVAVLVQSLLDGQVNVGLGPWAGPATLDDDILARATVAAVIEDATFDPAVQVKDDLPNGAVS